MEHAPLRPVPSRAAGPIDQAAAARQLAQALPELSPLEASALGRVAIAGVPRAEAAAALGVDERTLSGALATARKELRRTVTILAGSGWCERAERLISDRLDGPLVGADARRLDVHLRNCPRCVEHERRLVQATDAWVSTLAPRPTPAQPPPESAQPLTEVPSQPPAEEPTTDEPAPPQPPPGEPPPAETPPVEDAPTGEVLAEPPVLEVPPVEQPPVEVPPVEQPPVDEPVGQPPVEEPPVQETPTDEGPVQEPPVGEAPVEETPVDEAPVEEPVEEPPVEESPLEEPPVEELPVEEPPVDEPPVETPATATARPAPVEVAAAAEVLVAVRTRRQVAAAITWNALVVLAVLLALATIGLTIAGILGAEL